MINIAMLIDKTILIKYVIIIIAPSSKIIPLSKCESRISYIY